MREYIIVSTGHTKHRDKCITLWRPDARGYCWQLNAAGKYTEQEVMAEIDYYNGGYHSIAVLALVVEVLAEPCPAGLISGNPGLVVRNNKRNWKILLAAVVQPPKMAAPQSA